MDRDTVMKGLTLVNKIEDLETIVGMAKLAEADAVLYQFDKCDGIPVSERMALKKRYADEARAKLENALQHYRQALEKL